MKFTSRSISAAIRYKLRNKERIRVETLLDRISVSCPNIDIADQVFDLLSAEDGFIVRRDNPPTIIDVFEDTQSLDDSLKGNE